MKNLENYGVLVLNTSEVKQIDGGWIPFGTAVAIGVALYRFVSGLVDGYNEAVSDYV